MTNDQTIVRMITRAIRKEYDGAAKFKSKAAADQSCMALRRLAHRILGELKQERIIVDQVGFLKESCDGEVGEF